MLGWAFSFGIFVAYVINAGDPLLLVASAIFALAGSMGVKTFK